MGQPLSDFFIGTTKYSVRLRTHVKPHSIRKKGFLVHNVLYDKKRADELPIKLYTPNRYFYQPFLRKMDKKSVKSFVVNFPEIRNDATLGLAAGTDHDSPKWEIVLGASGGTETIIRPCNKCNFISRKKHSKAQFNQVSIFNTIVLSDR